MTDHAIHHPTNRARLTPFFIANAIQLFLIFLFFALVFPVTFGSEIHQGWQILGWTALFGVPLSLFEYFYHRYLLHSAVLPFMSAMHRAHSTHHGLTNVKAPVTPRTPDLPVEVASEYPIEEPHQEESMMFPLYSLPIFVVIFMILLGLPAKLLFPSQPVLTSLIISVTLYFSAYEIWHAILHLPFEKFWKPLLEKPWSKNITKRMYGFHLMHHWRPTANVSIVGLWGFAIWDHAFMTHRRPENMPLDGSKVTFQDAQIPKPVWPVSALDKAQGKFYKGSRKIEKTLARVFLGRKS